MDSTKLKQLNVINQMRRTVRSNENCTLAELLEQVGISETEYLEFGRIWREIGSEDKSASLRQTDQFIYLANLWQLLMRTNHIFKIAKLSEDKIRSMNLPVMGFYFGCRERDEIDVNENLPLLDQRKSLSDEKEDDDVEVDEVIDEWNLALKVHRLDVTMALMRETPLMEQMTSDSEKRKLINPIKDHLARRYPTRALMEEYVVYHANSLPETIAKTIIY